MADNVSTLNRRSAPTTRFHTHSQFVHGFVSVVFRGIHLRVYTTFSESRRFAYHVLRAWRLSKPLWRLRNLFYVCWKRPWKFCAAIYEHRHVCTKTLENPTTCCSKAVEFQTTYPLAFDLVPPVSEHWDIAAQFRLSWYHDRRRPANFTATIGSSKEPWSRHYSLLTGFWRRHVGSCSAFSFPKPSKSLPWHSFALQYWIDCTCGTFVACPRGATVTSAYRALDVRWSVLWIQLPVPQCG